MHFPALHYDIIGGFVSAATRFWKTWSTAQTCAEGEEKWKTHGVGMGVANGKSVFGEPLDNFAYKL